MKSTIMQLKQHIKQHLGTCDAPKPKLPLGTHRLKMQLKYTSHNYDYSYVTVVEREGK